MKSKPLTFAALSAVALLVSVESTVVLDRAGRIAARWGSRASAEAVATGTAHFAQGLARAIVCAVKP